MKMSNIKIIIYKLLSRIPFFLLITIVFIFSNKADAQSDSLRQLFTNANQPDSIRFNAIDQFYELNVFSQPDSIFPVASYHIELAQRKKTERERAKAIVRRAVAYRVKGDTDLSLIHISSPRDQRGSRMPSSA